MEPLTQKCSGPKGFWPRRTDGRRDTVILKFQPKTQENLDFEKKFKKCLQNTQFLLNSCIFWIQYSVSIYLSGKNIF